MTKIEQLARETRELFRPESPSKGRARVIASGRAGKAVLEVKDFAGEITVRRKGGGEASEIARFRDREEARAVARLLLEACAARKPRGGPGRP